jgi:predicted TPR repeat methyltransferase
MLAFVQRAAAASSAHSLRRIFGAYGVFAETFGFWAVNRKQRRAANRQGNAIAPRAAPVMPAGSSAEIADRFAAALSHHQAGRLAQAENLYRQVCAINPHHAESLHFLGVLAGQASRHDVAIDLIGQALAIKPDYAEAHYSFGQILAAQNRLDQAAAHYQRALTLRPDSAEISLAQGDALCRLNRHAESLAAYQRALALRPDFAEAWLACGNIFCLLKRYDEAFAACEKALALKPDFAEAWFGRGSIFARLRRYSEALNAYDKALTIMPEHARAWFGRGEALRGLNRSEEAVVAYRQALAKGGDAQLIQYTLASLGAEAAPVAASKEYVIGLFDGYADRFDEHLVDKLQYRIPNLLFDAILPLAPSGNLDILDLGCGTGLIGSLFRPLARTLIGVDISSNMLKIARQHQLYDDLICSELIEFLHTLTKTFDLAVAADVLIYIGDLSGVFHGVRGVLREGGLFAFSVEACEGQDFVLKATRRYAHSRTYLRKLAEDHGFVFETLESQVIRQQDGIDVVGDLAILRRS